MCLDYNLNKYCYLLIGVFCFLVFLEVFCDYVDFLDEILDKSDLESLELEKKLFRYVIDNYKLVIN